MLVLSFVLLYITGRGEVLYCTLGFSHYIFSFIHAGTDVSANADFSIIPSHQVVAEGQSSTFRCQHPHADDIVWLINGQSLTMSPLRDVTAQSGGNPLISSLYMTGYREYNRSSVECVATFGAGNTVERSPMAILLVQGPIQ